MRGYVPEGSWVTSADLREALARSETGSAGTLPIPPGWLADVEALFREQGPPEAE